MDSKNCIDCDCVLTDENWTPGRKKAGYYLCSPCQKIRTKVWREDNRKRDMLRVIRNSSKYKGIPFDLCEEDFEIPTVCPVLGIPLVFAEGGCPTDNSPSLDKFIPELGYVKGNVAVISMKANRTKSNATIEEVERLLYWMRHF